MVLIKRPSQQAIQSLALVGKHLPCAKLCQIQQAVQAGAVERRTLGCALHFVPSRLWEL